ncbi:tRNA-splicing endonuclease subunit Sen15 [Scheffersomyces coipomensis]|uniref:tRNA-splicing endonuclease subunit Sen15 n=1 Tax=Scheffersomyces coipomensis TaxID=1788519 RepID=UPI00315C57AF
MSIESDKVNSTTKDDITEHSLSEQVKLNLVHYNLWTNVIIHDTTPSPSSSVISGISPTSKQLEWIVPKSFTNKDITIPEIETWFVQITTINTKRPSKLIIAIVNDDSTVVYYNIHDGLVKPKQN